MASKSFSPRKSKLDSFRGVIGTLSDKEVAAKAGVTAENVRTYRLRRGIPAEWRGETADQLAKKDAAATKPARAPKGRKTRRRRASALDPYQDRLGRIPDRRVAELAGVSAENVRAYRKRHNIPAYWRGDGEASAPPAPTAEPTPAAVPTAAKTAAPARTRSNGARRYAYKVSAEIQGSTEEYVAFGADMAEAAAVATERLAALHPGAHLRSISVVGVAL